MSAKNSAKSQTIRQIPPAQKIQASVNMPRLLPLDMIDSSPAALADPDQQFLTTLMTALQTNDYESAIQVTRAHLEHTPKNTAVLNLLGSLYLKKHDDRNAEKTLLQAQRLAPDNLNILNNLACVHILRKDYKIAQTLLQGALRCGPDSVSAQMLYNSALAFGLSGQIDESEQVLTAAMKKAAFLDSFILACRLACVRGDLNSAEKILTAADTRFPNTGLIYFYKATVAMMQADLKSALRFISPAMAQNPADPHTGMLYASVLKNIKFDDYNPNQVQLIVQALQNPAINTGYLSQAWQSLFATAPLWKDAVEKGPAFSAKDAEELIDALKGEKALTTPFITLALERMVIRGPFAERVFTALRHAYLQRVAARPESLDESDLRFLSALAAQCFYNEYAYYAEPEEQTLCEKLRARLSPDSLEIADLLILTTYGPVLSILNETQAQLLADQPLFARLIVDQVENLRIERDLMNKLPRLTPIQDQISRAVENMYLENPYPVWLSTQYSGDTDFLNLAPDQGRRARVLIAGCGTGQHALMCALTHENVQVLAIDLSRRSLAYAWRKTLELKIPNISYAQADILELASLNQSFDLIESVGVLHHLAEPEKGLKILVDLLRPGGLMRLGFYSEIARAPMVAGREDVAHRALSGTADDIRKFRHDVLTNPETHPAGGLLKMGDFFTISTCRDLVFHVQEHRYTLPQIRDMLANHRLVLEEFNLDQPVLNAFQQMFPDPSAMKNLELWHQFELKNPDTFVNMYQFSVRKPARI